MIFLIVPAVIAVSGPVLCWLGLRGSAEANAKAEAEKSAYGKKFKELRDKLQEGKATIEHANFLKSKESGYNDKYIENLREAEDIITGAEYKPMEIKIDEVEKALAKLNKMVRNLSADVRKSASHRMSDNNPDEV